MPTPYPIRPILLVDDEENVLFSFDTELRANGYNHVLTVSDSRTALPLIQRNPPAVVLLDLWMPHVSGEELLERITTDYPEMPVIIVTGLNQVETAVRCMKAGAFDFLVKPVENGLLAATVARAVKFRELNDEVESLRKSQKSGGLTHPEVFESIITENENMLAVFRYIEAVAPGSQPVLILGETGTGKELLARAIHEAHPRSGPFVSVNAAGLDDAVFADTLFGHRKGAFTGAEETRAGLVEKAAGGTLFLDEIGDLSPASQLKLLRLAQEREYQALGEDRVRRMDARLVTATNQDLEDLVERGRFRKDLYFRLRTHLLRVPPLRERVDDLPVLLEHFLETAAGEFQKKKPTPPPELFSLLAGYDFPGNVRELQAMVYDAVGRHQGGVLSMAVFREQIRVPETSDTEARNECLREALALFSSCRKLPTLAQAAELLVNEALKRSGGNVTQAAGHLGITRQALSKRLKRA